MSEPTRTQPSDTKRPSSAPEPMTLTGTGGGDGSKPRGRGRQSVGEAFFMSLIRQVARSVGSAIVRAVIGRRR